VSANFDVTGLGKAWVCACGLLSHEKRVLKPWPVLQQGYDIIEDMYSPKTSATNFVQELCGCRAKENLAPLLQLVTSSFDVFAVRLLV